VAYLTRLMPMCVIWDRDDDVIPVSHAYSAQAYAPGVEVHVVARAGHFPHKERPAQVAQILTDFVDSTPSATYHRRRWRRLMQRGDVAELAADPDRPVVEPARHGRGRSLRG